MKGREHIWFSLMMNPNMNPELLYKVNRGLDEPSGLDFMFNRVAGNKWNIPGLNYGGHRQWNHDLLTAMMKGFQIGGYQGAKAAWLHLMADRFSDNIANNTGSTDIRDALMSMVMASNKVPHWNFNK